jgi:hypothetical protein
VHSFFYADFFEDPTTWLLLGFVALAAPVPRTAQEEERPPSERKEPVPA